MTRKDPAKIHWSPRLRPLLLKRLYDSDATGIRDVDLCDAVGTTLFARCRTFVLVRQNQVECPACRTVFVVSSRDESHCPQEGCDWYTTGPIYRQSTRNHHAYPGRAMEAFRAFYRRYPNARTYTAKVVLIDQLIHSFHIAEKTGTPTKSVASKLLEGNKKAVVRFLDDLSALDQGDKEKWRRAVAGTIDRRTLRSDPPGEE